MPPHGGGHGGGHGGHHGGHHGGGHGHHGGGGRRPGGWGGGWGPGVWYSDPVYTEVVVPSCPGTLDPVLATDGRTYNNECEARAAGYAVVRHVAPSKLSEYVTIGEIIPGVPNLALLAGALAAYLLIRRR